MSCFDAACHLAQHLLVHCFLARVASLSWGSQIRYKVARCQRKRSWAFYSFAGPGTTEICDNVRLHAGTFCESLCDSTGLCLTCSRQLSVPAPVVNLRGWLLQSQPPLPPIQPPLPPIQPHSWQLWRPKRKLLQRSDLAVIARVTSSPQITTTAAAAADFDPLPEPQQPAQEAVASEDAKPAKEEDAGEVAQQEDQHEKKGDKGEKDFNHEEDEDTHEEKTDSNHPESQDGSASASGSQDQEPIARQESSSEQGLNCSGESWWCRWHHICSCCQAQPCARDCTGSGSTTGTVFASGNVPMANERSSNTNAQCLP